MGVVDLSAARSLAVVIDHRSRYVLCLVFFFPLFFGVSLFTARRFDVSAERTRAKDRSLISYLKRTIRIKRQSLSEAVFYENGSTFPFTRLCLKKEGFLRIKSNSLITREIKFLSFSILFSLFFFAM